MCVCVCVCWPIKGEPPCTNFHFSYQTHTFSLPRDLYMSTLWRWVQWSLHGNQKAISCHCEKKMLPELVSTNLLFVLTQRSVTRTTNRSGLRGLTTVWNSSSLHIVLGATWIFTFVFLAVAWCELLCFAFLVFFHPGGFTVAILGDSMVSSGMHSLPLNYCPQMACNFCNILNGVTYRFCLSSVGWRVEGSVDSLP